MTALTSKRTLTSVAYLHMAVDDLRDAIDEAAENGELAAAEDIYQHLSSLKALIKKLTDADGETGA